MINEYLVWVRKHRYCKMSGEPAYAVDERIRRSDWIEGKHYRRTSPRVLWINVPEVMAWVAGR